MTFVIQGIGTRVPPLAMSQKDASSLFFSFAEPAGGRQRALQALFRRSGVTRRHSVLLESEEGSPHHRQRFYPPARDAMDQGPTTWERMGRYEEEAPILAAGAARLALEDAGADPDTITHLVTVSCTGFFAPGLDARLVETLGLPRGVERTHVGFMGCHGAMNGLRIGAAHTGSDPQARALICAVELCSLHVAYGWDPEDMVANAIFADGAAAMVGVSEGARDASQDPGSDDNSGSAWRVTSNGTLLMPGSSEAMSWRIGDHGFRMTLSPRVPDLIQAHLEPWLREWLGGEGLTLEDVASWAVHPGGPRILDAVEGALGLEKEATSVAREVLAEHGNMSSATILFILQRMREQDVPRPLVALAFGPGLVAEAVLIR